MSYRTLKRLLGETNFEVKCLVLFGFGLSVLALVTFWLYWWQTRSLISDQNRTTSQLMISPMIQQLHWEWYARENAELDESAAAGAKNTQDATDKNVGETDTVAETEGAVADPISASVRDVLYGELTRIENLNAELQPERLQNFKFELVRADWTTASASERPGDAVAHEALRVLSAGETDEHIVIDRESGEYRYFRAIVASASCVECHEAAEGEMMAMAGIRLPLEAVEENLHASNAFVITAEFVKVVLAILAIYLVVRYVITKPVLHLKKVSDAIAHGNLEMRADIRTGDEFEELSHAFNRMLRHMVTVQDELREVNADLDGKVDELASVNLQLYEMNNVKDEFLATMSHELRTPLNSILGFSDVLAAAANLNDKQQRYVSNIQSSGRSLMTMINDILDLAKIESGKMELHPAEFSMKDLIERHVSTMTQMAERRNIALSWSVDPSLPTLFQDPGKLQQVLNNLLSNAIKFTPEGGRVRVSAERNSDRCVLTIEDNGIGIPLDEQERIFEKFRQGKGQPGQKDTLTRKYEGTGLGLSIVKEISKLLGGDVTLQSEFGKGSTFTVTFPLVLDAVDSSDEEATSRLVGLNRFRSVDLKFPGRESDETSATTGNRVDQHVSDDTMEPAAQSENSN
ncbi:MAG: sensor histidine kinase [Planctomycetota bacterium]|jgi:signal transduction histidine kinase